MKTFTKFNPIVQVKPVMNSIFPICAKKLFKVTFLLLLLFSVSSIKAATYYLTSAGASTAHIPASWNTNPDGGGTAATNFTSSNDVFIVPSGISGIIDGNITIGTTSDGDIWELRVLGTLTINDTRVISIQHKYDGSGSGSSLNVNGPNGKIIFKDPDSFQIQNITLDVTSAGSSNFNLNSGSSLETVNQNGILGTQGSILPSVHFNVTLNSAAN